MIERVSVEVTELVAQVTGALMPLAVHSGLELVWTRLAGCIGPRIGSHSP